MKQFMMRGKAITGPMRYRDFFSPRDLLEHRELAAGFFLQQYGWLSTASRYHAGIFYLAAFGREFAFSQPEQYGHDSGVLCGFPQYRQRNQLREQFALPQQRRLLDEIWALSRAADLPEEDWQRLFVLLAAGYSLAASNLAESPLSPAEAQQAYLRISKSSQDSDGWLSFEGDGTMVLPARQEPYRILMARDGDELLEAGAVITPRKILAAPHAQGNLQIPVTLRLYSAAEDPDPLEVGIAPGDYRYANVVEGHVVWVHPVSVQTPGCRMERLGGTLSVTDARGNCQTFSCAGLEIIGFAPEDQELGWVLLSEHGADYSAYSHRLTYGTALPDDRVPIVQAEFREAECLLLDQHGYVHSNLYPVSGHRVTFLRNFQR